MKFKTMYNKQDSVFINPGSPIKDEYQLRVVDNSMSLVKVGESSLYDYIQSHADSVDIHKILERCALMDDYSILNRMPAQFMDVSEMPSNLAEAFEQIQDSKNFFNKLPIEIKEKYENNYLLFLSSLGSKEFDSIVGDYLQSIKPSEPLKEIVVDES